MRDEGDLLWEDDRWHPWCEPCGAWLAEGNPDEGEARVLLSEHLAELHD
jgi:hypothetical protein